jgi:2-iminobutanoate/2-iminopropanoate deaminase
VYVTDLRERERIYAVRREFFADDPPTSTMLQVSGFVHPDALIEISAIGVLPG